MFEEGVVVVFVAGFGKVATVQEDVDFGEWSGVVLKNRWVLWCWK